MSEREMTETKTWRMIERQRGAQQRLGSGNTRSNQNLVLRDPDNPFVPGVVGTDGTPIPRLKPVPLGKRAIGFFLMKSMRCRMRCEMHNASPPWCRRARTQSVN
jgi:hypothetical protein